MKTIFFTIIAVVLFATGAAAQVSKNAVNTQLADLKNFHIDNANMVSSGLPNKKHFEALKAMGITHVIDLIPGDRQQESNLMKELDLSYYNIQVEWGNPTIENFHEYIATMQQFNKSAGITLTHCRLNWRGAVFTYLYRVTQLNEPEELAKQDMLAIWEPNDTWQDFINQVLAN